MTPQNEIKCFPSVPWAKGVCESIFMLIQPMSEYLRVTARQFSTLHNSQRIQYHDLCRRVKSELMYFIWYPNYLPCTRHLLRCWLVTNFTAQCWYLLIFMGTILRAENHGSSSAFTPASESGQHSQLCESEPSSNLCGGQRLFNFQLW